MRTLSLIAVALLATACAERHPPIHDRPPPFGGPPGGTGPGGEPGREARTLFISPMGEPFRQAHPEKAWFAGADADGDGRITPTEFRADAARFFQILDRQDDGEIDPDDVEVYENQLAPEIRVRDRGGSGRAGGSPDNGGRAGRGRPGGPGGGDPGGGGPGGGFGGGRRGGPGERSGDGVTGSGDGRPQAQGAARHGYLDLPEPVTSADRNFNRGIDANEFARAAVERFALLDRNRDGVLTAGDLPAVDTRLRGGDGSPGGRRGPPPGNDHDGGRRDDADRDTDGQ